ncbi:MAG: hypothetical protein JWO69_1441 [Thermoleophilia bacterium]|jgi:hypothetical protein|nr:hypothetical protein [Thermoleophilia bacterium]
MAKITESVQLRERRQLTLPKSISDRFKGVDRYDVTVEGGRIVLTPKVELDVSWFHSDEWQAREAAADAALSAGRVTEFETGADAIAAARRRRAERDT